MDKFIPIRLSHSSLQTLHTCERKWQIDRLLVEGYRDEDSEHTVFGKAFGHGIATYFITQDAEQSLFQAWYEYFPELETDKKNQTKMVLALNAAFSRIDTLLEEYEIAYFNGKPAAELSFRLNIDEEYYFVGHIDLVLRHRFTKVYSVLEVKTTGLLFADLRPLYQNSGQALGYSIALDKIAGKDQTSYELVYMVAQMQKDWTSEIKVFPFAKNLGDRLRWFMTLGLDVQHIKEMAELDVYPQRGHSCIQYMRPCKYFGTCGLTSQDEIRKREEDPIVYDFVFDLETVIAEHVARVYHSPAQAQTLTLLESM